MVDTASPLLAAYDVQLRRHVPVAPPPGEVHELLGPVLRVSGRHEGFIETGPDVGVHGDALDALIAEHRDFFAARGEPVEWKTRSHDAPADLPDRLVAAGFVAGAPETVMVAPVQALVGADGTAAGLPDGVSIRQVVELADFGRITALQAEVWGADHGPTAREMQAEAAADPAHVLVFTAEAGGEVVSAARLVILPGTDFAGLWGGSTLAAWRGRGLYRALVAARAEVAAARGVKYLQVDASADSAPILARLGFIALTTTTPYQWSPPRR
ncbi:GNAT family N-acetyltransferase [Specibacter cremeus]|uniref:GNAT family N-acetyltransferase n=1 Tax=Specibacter cremeus TaxID=1629051 RepID=UPI000F77F444|nr:GNAT family N-acetyltransferase [Specibacter cremeus]